MVCYKIYISKVFFFNFLFQVEVVGVGFINISLSYSFVLLLLKDVFINGVQFFVVLVKKRCVVDFLLLNIVKEMYVGYLRSIIIGESFC